jgi:perosamine synthetase
MESIQLSIPNLTGNEKKYLLDCIETNFVSSVGPYVQKFEEEFAKFHEVKNAVAVMNGTAALHISLILSGVKKDDHVFMPSLSFIAAANAISYTGGKPVLIDSNWDTLSLCPKSLERFLSENYEVVEGTCFHKKNKTKAKAIVVIHTFGNIAQMDEILEIAKKYKLKVIEDACEALGAKYKGKHAGTMGDFGCFSFNGNKIVTSGSGGMLLSKNDEDSLKAKHLTTTAKVDSLYFEHDEIGYNYRMVNVLAAIGLAQFERIEEFLETKKKNFEIYKRELGNIEGVSLHESTMKEASNYWFYSLVVGETCKVDRSLLMDRLIGEGINVRPAWTLIENQLPFKGILKSKTEKSLEIQSRIISLPCSTNLSEDEILRICNFIKKTLK